MIWGPIFSEGQSVTLVGHEPPMYGTVTYVADARERGGGIVYSVLWQDGGVSREAAEQLHPVMK